ncbi:DNRLRE domain-containing protein [Nonomuraea sp. NPDC049637]|uniref:DNRLRE domain-containing protein n=1 Tax=Nonomuraea sp. NPDC049637 TaxID=3154356 RepID=UPI0034332AF8
MTDHRLADRAPDPSQARTPDDYVALLNELRLWCGNPSLRRLRQLGGLVVAPSGAKVHALAPSTMSYVLTGRGLPRLPKLEFVRGFVGACLASCGDPASSGPEVERWVTAWRRLARPATGQPPPPPPSPDPGAPTTVPAAVPEVVGGAPATVPREVKGSSPGRRTRRHTMTAILLVGVLVWGYSVSTTRPPHHPAPAFPPTRAAPLAPAKAAPAANVEVAARLDVSVSGDRVLATGTTLQAGASYRAYLAFDLPPATGRRVKSARLLLWNHASPGCGAALDGGIEVRRVTSSWSDSTLTPGRQPGTTTEGAAVSRAAHGGPHCDGGYLRFDVTGIVRAWTAGEPEDGLQVRAHDEDDPHAWRRFYAGERGEEGAAPRLDIVYNAVPGTPSMLGQSIGTSLTLSAAVADPDGEWLDAEFELSVAPAHGTSTSTGMVIWRGSASTRAGRPGTVTVDRALLRPDVLYRWRVRGDDGTDTGPWTGYRYVRLPGTGVPTSPTAGAGERGA